MATTYFPLTSLVRSEDDTTLSMTTGGTPIIELGTYLTIENILQIDDINDFIIEEVYATGLRILVRS